MSFISLQGVADMSLALDRDTAPTAAETAVSDPIVEPAPTGRLYRVVWRWHFYAGLLVVPFMVMLAITGIIYLFKPQLDALMYPLHVQPGQTTLSASRQVEAVLVAYPDASMIEFRPAPASDRSAIVGIATADERSLAVFVNPYTGQVLGERDENWNLQWAAVTLHGELMIGTIGDYVVELAACWALVLVITGLYLWWPRKGFAIWGTLLPRLRASNKRIFWRDLHAVPGFWGAFIVAFLIITGLPWAGFWGDTFAQVWNRYPAELWNNVPVSTQLTGSLNEDGTKNVPWAAEALPMPKSNSSHANHSGQSAAPVTPVVTADGIAPGTPVNLDSVVALAQAKGVAPGYTVTLPDGEEGVYTVGLFHDQPQNSRTMHIDQYSGKVLADIGWEQYGLVPKGVELGIALHEGRYFGFLNQLLMLFAALVVILLAVSGTVMWWRRRPADRLGAPAMPKNMPLVKGFLVLTVALGALFPLVGISLTIVVLLDWLLLSRVPALRQAFG
jgi:uncharacterized iron-regulated membrane protein